MQESEYRDFYWAESVVSYIWAGVLCSLTLRDDPFGMRITLGSSSLVPWLVRTRFRDISGAVPEWPWISGFRRKSSRRDSAPKVRISDLLNSRDNFFVTLTSICSETWVIQSSCDLGTFEFCVKLASRMFLTILFLKGCKISRIPQICHFLRKKYWAAINIEVFFMKKSASFTVTMFNVGKRNYKGY